jgi:apurinic endonuclease APN1
MSSPERTKSTTTATKATGTKRARATRATNGAAAVIADERVTVKTTVASRKKAVSVKTEVTTSATKTAKRTSNGTAKVKEEQDEESELSELSDLSDLSELEEKPKPAPKKRKTKAKPEPADGDDSEAEAKPKKKKRRTKAEKEAEEAMVLAARTAATALKRAMFIGAHVSAAGGVHNSIQNATKIGANAFALFLKSQRKWENPPLQDEHRDEFHSRLKSHDYDAAKHVLPHGSYLVNLAQADKTRADQAYGSFIDDLRRCEALGIRLYNFHPGATGGDTKEAACGRIAAQLNRAIGETKFVVPLLECMCGTASGNVIGSRFEELRDIIALIGDKSRIGVCLDTCHAFAAGYDLRTPEAFEETMSRFDEIVGIKYLKALHCKLRHDESRWTWLTRSSKRQQSALRITSRSTRQHRYWLPRPTDVPQRHELRALPTPTYGP